MGDRSPGEVPRKPGRGDRAEVVRWGESTGLHIHPDQRRAYIAARGRGATKSAAAREAGISRTTAYGIEASYVGGGKPDSVTEAGGKAQGRKPSQDRGRVGNPYAAQRSDEDAPLPRHPSQLRGEAAAALRDGGFGLFRRRYLGRQTSPWQEEAAAVMLAHLLTPTREYVVVNAPPGPGKSTLFTHDLIVWLICRDRSVRIMVGSRTYSQAERYVNRVRRTLMRGYVVQPPQAEVEAGKAVPATGCLVDDYGRFRPLGQESWQKGGFVVAQLADMLVTDKEPTCAAYGLDSDYLGFRFDVVVWDDLVDGRMLRSPDARDALIEKYEHEATTRLEPGGLFVLQGQRLGAHDLYGYCRDKRVPFIDPETGEEDLERRRPEYTHVTFPAHFEDRCQGQHGRGAPAYPDGCLLDPLRLPWHELRAIQLTQPDKYRVLYQQEDTDPRSVLVDPIWVKGGWDPGTGEEFPGCWDDDRPLATPPGDAEHPLAAPSHSIVTCDPSASNFWAVQWWLYNVPSGLRYLLDTQRRKMMAPDLLDWNHSKGQFTGLLEEWWQRSRDLGHQVRWWVVEANAAQRFLLQYDHARRWSQQREVTIVPHNTSKANKPDSDMGVESTRNVWRYGKVRLPGLGLEARTAANLLVREATRYPATETDDQVMAHWFLEWTLPRLFPAQQELQRQKRPTWLTHSTRRQQAYG